MHLTRMRNSVFTFGANAAAVFAVVGVVNLVNTASAQTSICWGDNTYGTNSPPPGVSDIVDLDAGQRFFVAARADGTVLCWGWNLSGVCTSIPSGLNDVQSVAAGVEHVLALRQGGEIVAWGSNSFGERDVPATLGTAVAISAGFYFSVALDSSGTPVCWG
jgi:alpha-tubulin suppressor-like RCC1 family protein